VGDAVFVMQGWTLWAARLMMLSRGWLVTVDVMEVRWRKLGWSCVGCGALRSVRGRILSETRY
jgi:hypothetical protein